MEARFHKRLYQKGAVKEAVREFEHLAKFELVEDGEYIVVRIFDPDPDVADVIKEEFANFVLYYTVERRKR